MLTVEERHELIQGFEAVQAIARNTSPGIDGALRGAIEREAVAREFYAALNRCTDWGVPS